jgi:peptidoglycan/xylan/chitin deacetylase (PgdA/CDA1 family)
MWEGFVAAVALTAIALAVPPSVSGAVLAASPPHIGSTSLRQEAQRLVWSVSLDRPFSSFKTLKRRHWSVCLLIERLHGGRPVGEVCAVYRPDGPALRYSAVGPHLRPHFQTVAGSITRPNSRSLKAIFPPSSARLSFHSGLRWQTQTSVAPPACVAPPSSPKQCVKRLPHHPTRLELHVPRLVGCEATGPKWVFHGPSRGRMIALTFDDGPWYDTPQFLHVLETKHVVATFFQIGDQISTYGGPGGAIEKRMLRDGDIIGDHSWSHPNLSGDGSFAYKQIRSTALAIQRATGGFYPCLFRAPYGATSPALLDEARRMGFTTIQWDVDPRDWSLPGTQAIYSNVVNNAHPGAIVIQHDGGGPRQETLAALPHEIDTLRARGYHFVTVAQLLGYRLIYK